MSFAHLLLSPKVRCENQHHTASSQSPGKVRKPCPLQCSTATTENQECGKRCLMAFDPGKMLKKQVNQRKESAKARARNPSSQLLASLLPSLYRLSPEALESQSLDLQEICSVEFFTGEPQPGLFGIFVLFCFLCKRKVLIWYGLSVSCHPHLGPGMVVPDIGAHELGK